jgi:predicted dehydrogenase
MEVYGRTGYVHTPDGRTMRLRTSGDQPERVVTPPDRPAALAEPFAYFRAVIRGTVRMNDADLSALPNNLTVMRILEAAKESARTGRTVRLETR